MNQKAATSSIKILSGGIGNYPIKLELVPKRLVVAIYQQNLPGKGSQIPCWIFVSHGLSALKQRELVLIMRINRNIQANKLPKPPLSLFMFLFKAILQKKRFAIGDVIGFGVKGLMGFGGMGCTFSDVKLQNVNLPAHYLHCVLLTKEELAVAHAFGLTRVLARMGFESNRYPFNPWNDTERSGLPLQSVIQNSDFKNRKSLLLKHSSVNLVAGEKVVLVIAPATHSTLTNHIKLQGNSGRLDLITQLLPYHEGVLVWLPEKDSIEMNVHPDLEGNVIAGSYVSFIRSDQSGATMVEDGFQVNLDDQAWLMLRNAMARKQNIIVNPSSGDMEFALIWNTMSNPETHSGINLATGLGESEGEGSAGNGGLLGKLKRLIRRG